MASLIPQTVSARMLALGAASMIALVSTGAGLYWAGNRLINDQVAIVTNAEALRNHMEMDIIHDKMRANVFSALAATGTTFDVPAIQADADKNYKAFEELVEANLKLALPETVRNNLDQTRTPLKNYFRSSQLIIELSSKDRVAALSELKDFEKSSQELESALSVGGERIMSHSKDTVERSRRFAKFTALLFVASLGLAWLLQAFFYMSIQKLLIRPLGIMGRTMLSLAEGNLETSIEGDGRNDELGDMARAVKVFRDNAIAKNNFESEANRNRMRADETREMAEAERRSRVEAELATAQDQQKFLSALTDGLARLSSGDISFKLPTSSNQMHQTAVNNFNSMVVQISDIAIRIGTAGASVRGATSEIGAGVSDLSVRTEQQASALEQTAASMEELAATVRQNSDNAQEANQLASSARQLAMSGADIAGRAESAMDQIEKSSREVGDIISLIEEIAFQTNILALNAAVEAARAGEAGRGFAVVANEVRALAQRSAKASKDIKLLIATTDENVVEGVKLARQASGALENITTSVRKVADIVSEIAAASQEQSTGIDQVSRAITNMDEMTQQNALLVEETNAALQSAKAQVDELQQAVSFFKTGNMTGAPAAIELPPLPKNKMALIETKAVEAQPVGQPNIGLHEKLRQLALKMAAKQPTRLRNMEPPGAAVANADWREF